MAIYQTRIHNALVPNVMSHNCDVKVGEAKKAMSEYQKAIGLIDGCWNYSNSKFKNKPSKTYCKINSKQAS